MDHSGYLQSFYSKIGLNCQQTHESLEDIHHVKSTILTSLESSASRSFVKAKMGICLARAFGVISSQIRSKHLKEIWKETLIIGLHELIGQGVEKTIDGILRLSVLFDSYTCFIHYEAGSDLSMKIGEDAFEEYHSIAQSLLLMSIWIIENELRHEKQNSKDSDITRDELNNSISNSRLKSNFDRIIEFVIRKTEGFTRFSYVNSLSKFITSQNFTTLENIPTIRATSDQERSIITLFPV